MLKKHSFLKLCGAAVIATTLANNVSALTLNLTKDWACDGSLQQGKVFNVSVGYVLVNEQGKVSDIKGNPTNNTAPTQVATFITNKTLSAALNLPAPVVSIYTDNNGNKIKKVTAVPQLVVTAQAIPTDQAQCPASRNNYPKSTSKTIYTYIQGCGGQDKARTDELVRAYNSGTVTLGVSSNNWVGFQSVASEGSSVGCPNGNR